MNSAKKAAKKGKDDKEKKDIKDKKREKKASADRTMEVPLACGARDMSGSGVSSRACTVADTLADLFCCCEIL